MPNRSLSRPSLTSLLLLLFAASCAPVYLPAPPSAPLVLRQGDIALSGNMSTGALGNVSVAYAFIDNFSVLAETTFDPQTNEHNDYKFSGMNAAVGYNTTVGKQWRADFYVGGGLGTGEARGDNSIFFSSSSDLRRARFTNILGQVDLGRVEESLEVAYQFRGSYVMFNRFERISENFGAEGTVTEIEIEYGHEDIFYMEHSFVLRLGSERIKFLGFINATSEWNGERTRTSLHMPLSIGLGFQFRLNAFDLSK